MVTRISNFLATVLKVCSVPSLIYWQQVKFLPQFSTPEFELLAEKEYLHNILPKFDACRLQLLDLLMRLLMPFLMRLSFDPKILSFSGFVT